MSGKLKSGDKVVEADISDFLEISRAPVREALRSLSVQGIIVFFPRKGHFIPVTSREEIFEVFQIRISLELQVLRLLVRKQLLADTDYAHLMELARQMEDEELATANQGGPIFHLNTLDISFHKYLWQVSGSVRRAQLLESLFLQLLIEMNKNVASLGSYKEKAAEHYTLIAALKTGDIQAVCMEFKQHLRRYVVAALGNLSEEEERTWDSLFD